MEIILCNYKWQKIVNLPVVDGKSFMKDVILLQGFLKSILISIACVHSLDIVEI